MAKKQRKGIALIIVIIFLLTNLASYGYSITLKKESQDFLDNVNIEINNDYGLENYYKPLIY